MRDGGKVNSGEAVRLKMCFTVNLYGQMNKLRMDDNLNYNSNVDWDGKVLKQMGMSIEYKYPKLVFIR